MSKLVSNLQRGSRRDQVERGGLFSPVLKDSVLLGAGGVVDGDVGNLPLPAQQVGTLPVDVHHWERLVVLEGVQSPPALGDASLWGLVVLDHHPSEGVGIFRQGPRQSKVGLFLVHGGGGAALPLLGLTEGLLLPALLKPLPVLSASVVMLLSICLLVLECLLVSLPGSLSSPLPRPLPLLGSGVRLPPAPPLQRRLVALASPAIVSASVLLSFLWRRNVGPEG